MAFPRTSARQKDSFSKQLARLMKGMILPFLALRCGRRIGISMIHPLLILPNRLPGVAVGQVDQLEDRYLGMVEASGSNPDLSIYPLFRLNLLRALSYS